MTPRTLGFPVGERTALLGEGHRDIRDAEEAEGIPIGQSYSVLQDLCRGMRKVLLSCVVVSPPMPADTPHRDSLEVLVEGYMCSVATLIVKGRCEIFHWVHRSRAAVAPLWRREPVGPKYSMCRSLQLRYIPSLLTHIHYTLSAYSSTVLTNSPDPHGRPPLWRRNSKWAKVKYYVPSTAWIPRYSLSLCVATLSRIHLSAYLPNSG